MPPPRARPPGHSRKAQYGLFLGYVAAVTGMLFAVLLLVLSVFDRRGFDAVVTGVSDVTAPLSGGGRGIARGTEDLIDGIRAYIDAGSKNRAMAEELRSARTRLVEAEALAFQNRRLRALLDVRRDAPNAIVAARLVASTPVTSRRFATLDAGRSDGVRPNQPVIAAEGLVGRVEAAGGASARVQLLTDPGNVVPVRRASDGLPAIATGAGDGGIDVRPLVSGSNPFRPGDLVVTSGVGGIYAPGVPVGHVVRLSTDGALVRPRAEPGRVDFVLVYPLYLPPLPPPQTMPTVDE